MSHRTRASRTSASSPISPSKSKKKPVSIRKMTLRSVQKKTPVKKSSPTKHHVEQTSPSALIQPRQKRLSSLTAATLLQFCTSILSPSRKLKSTPKKVKTKSPINRSSTSRKLQVSNVSENKTELHIPTRTRREASSRASAMIMQQNEIERSRYNYSLANEHSKSTIRRYRSKSTVTNKEDIPPEPVKFNIPSIPPLPAPAPSIIDASNQTECTQSSTTVTRKSIDPLSSTNSKYPSLTEDILAEHNRLHETIKTKHDNLLKWTEELALCGRLSPAYPSDEIPPESLHSNSKEITRMIIFMLNKILFFFLLFLIKRWILFLLISQHVHLKIYQQQIIFQLLLFFFHHLHILSIYVHFILFCLVGNIRVSHINNSHIIYLFYFLVLYKNKSSFFLNSNLCYFCDKLPFSNTIVIRLL
jgi:hypothetical protein